MYISYAGWVSDFGVHELYGVFVMSIVGWVIWVILDVQCATHTKERDGKFNINYGEFVQTKL